MKKNNRGFTLAELLIVVAIIAVLVAIAIPVFTNQLAKAELATATANVRAAYADELSNAMAESNSLQTDGKVHITGAFLSEAGDKCTAAVSGTTCTVTHTAKGYKNTFPIDEDVVIGS